MGRCEIHGIDRCSYSGCLTTDSTELAGTTFGTAYVDECVVIPHMKVDEEKAYTNINPELEKMIREIHAKMFPPEPERNTTPGPEPYTVRICANCDSVIKELSNEPKQEVCNHCGY